jgi:hypothetical protein
MPKRQFNISIDVDLMDRFTQIYGEGNRAKRIGELVEKDCIETESKQLGFKVKRIWFEKTIKPFIKKHVGYRDLFSFIENGELQPAFKEAKITISDADIKLCIEQILSEGEE